MSNYVVTAQGDDISTLVQTEEMLKEGEFGEVRAFVTAPPSEQTLANIQEDMVNKGVTLTGPIVYDAASGAVIVRFQKMMSPMETIGLSLGVLVVVGSMIFAWQLAQQIGGSGPAAIWILLGILGFILFIKSTEGKAVMKGTGRVAEKAAMTAIELYGERKAFGGQLEYQRLHAEYPDYGKPKKEKKEEPRAPVPPRGAAGREAPISQRVLDSEI
jgi:hypothetical protein